MTPNFLWLLGGFGLLLLLFVSWQIFRLRRQSALPTDVLRLSRELEQSREALATLRHRNGGLEAEARQLRERLSEERERSQALEQKLAQHLEQMGLRFLREEGQRLNQQQQEGLQQVLKPFREGLANLSLHLETTRREGEREVANLRGEVRQLSSLNQVLGQEARALTQAIRGDQRIQGRWGEVQLERLLEASGLLPQVQYRLQEQFTNQEGLRLRPDALILLPGQRHLIIDAKVSLTHYLQYEEASDPEEAAGWRQKHLQSVRAHIRSLSGKNYPRIQELDSPDYVILFFPSEAPLQLALREAPDLLEEAARQKILLMSPAALLVALRTAATLWQSSERQKNAEEIARQGGLLLDRLTGFVNQLDEVEQRLDQTRNAFLTLRRRLDRGERPGDTLLGRARRLHQLGLSGKHPLPPPAQEEHPTPCIPDPQDP